MINILRRRFALSEQGAKDLVKGCLSCALSNIILMIPVTLIYYMINDLMSGGVTANYRKLYIS